MALVALALAAAVGCGTHVPVQPGEIAVRARYTRAPGPCIELDEQHTGRPIVGTFEVAAVVSGVLPARTVICVRPFSGPQAYPKDLEVGRTYRLRLRPAAETRRVIGELEATGRSPFLWVGGNEIVVE